MMNLEEGLEIYHQLLVKNPTMPVTQVLPLMFQLNGKPYEVTQRYFPQEPLFKFGKIPRRAVTIAGRQVAKCLDPRTKVLTGDRQEVELGDIRVGDLLLTHTGEDLEQDIAAVGKVFRRSRKVGVRIRTAHRDEVVASMDHRFLTPEGWKCVKELTSSDCLAHSIPEGLVWSPITDLQTLEEMEMVDIEIDHPDHNFVAGGVVSHNSTSMAPSQLLRAAAIPYYHILTVTPLFEQIRRYSNNVVKPFISGSALKDLFIMPGIDNSVLQRSLPNGSNLYYSYIGTSADRARGLAVSEVDADEIQDIDMDLMPIVHACMSASPWKIERYGGTPKTTSNGLEALWDKSSKGIWHIPCQNTGCKKENVCHPVEGHLLKMLGDKTLICAFCGHPVDSRLGYYVHLHADRQLTFAGYHMPQPIFPMHYADPNAWAIIKEAQREKPTYIFYNEFLGASYDVGAQMITAGELQEAAVVPFTSPSQHKPGDYIMTVTGCDYGGRGKQRTTDKEDFISNTAIAVAAMRTDGVVEVDYIKKVPYENNPTEENEILASVATASFSDWTAIDYAGAGNVHETLLVSAGWPRQRITPFTYASMSVNKPIVFYTPPGMAGVRDTYTLDKSRSLQLLVHLIKAKKVLLPRWESASGLLNDFFAIFSETTEGPNGSPKTLVKRIPKKTDDVVHAINFAVMALYHATDRWPDLVHLYTRQEKDEGSWTEADTQR